MNPPVRFRLGQEWLTAKQLAFTWGVSTDTARLTAYREGLERYKPLPKGVRKIDQSNRRIA